MVHTRLAAIRSKKYILPTNSNLNNTNTNLNEVNECDNDASTNNVIDDVEVIVPETQTQIVYATELGSTGSIGEEDQLPEESFEKAPEL